MNTSAQAHFDRQYQLHLKLKGLQPKTIDAYARAIRRIGDYFDHRIDGRRLILNYVMRGF